METLIDHIYYNAENIGDNVAIRTKKESITFKEIAARIEITAGYFMTLGIKSGERVILEAIPEIDYVISYLALQYIGAVTAPVERGINIDQLKYVAELIDAKMYLSKKDSRLNKTIRSEFYGDVMKDANNWNHRADHKKADINAVSEIIFTTGTTGRPKGAMHSVDGISCNTANTVNGIGMLPDDIILLPLPLNHSFGMRVLRSSLQIGACVILQNGAIFADALIDSINKYNCNAMACVSATMESVLREIGEERVTEEFSKLRYIEFSAGAVPRFMREKLIELLPETHIHNTWGSSETGGCLFLDLKEKPEKIGAVGKALDHIFLAVYSKDSEEFITGTGCENIGCLAIKGEMVFKGYWKQEDLFNESIVDGWYVTNDLVWQDDDGYFYILGRADNVINIGGEKVAPSEIENIIFTMPEILDCACIGIPDSDGILGEVPMLIYSVKDGKTVDVSEIEKNVTAKIGVYKAPRAYAEIKAIPKNYIKKTDYKLLKNTYKSSGIKGLTELAVERPVTAERKIELYNPVINTILNRKSKRDFTDEEVPKEVIEMLVEAAKKAPSGKNLQTRRFTVISNANEISDFKALVRDVASEKNTGFRGFENPPLLILISNERRNKDGIQDVGVSAENIMIAAESYGLGSVWLNPLMDISDDERIRERLDKYMIPKSHIVWAVMAIGFPASEPPEFFRKPNEVYYVS